jgi:hypothetical protein
MSDTIEIDGFRFNASEVADPERVRAMIRTAPYISLSQWAERDEQCNVRLRALTKGIKGDVIGMTPEMLANTFFTVYRIDRTEVLKMRADGEEFLRVVEASHPKAPSKDYPAAP